MHIVHGDHFWQFGSITSLAAETIPNMASEVISECLVLNLGEPCPQTPLACSHLLARNGHTSLK